jgi:isocitrate dehydrogenase
MTQGDFYGSEQSTAVKEDTDVSIEFSPKNGEPRVLKKSTALEAGEVIDASFMSVSKLCNFLEDEIQDAKDAEILFSLHLKVSVQRKAI